MPCTKYRDLISRYVDNEVTPRQRRDLLAHVETCRDCAAWLARLRQTDVLLKGVPETHPSDRVRQAVLSSALKKGAPPIQPSRRPAYSGGGGLRFFASDLLLRFDLPPKQIVVAASAVLLAVVGLGYWLNLIPPLTGYDKFGFLFPREQEQAPVQRPPIEAISSGAGGVGGPVAAPNLVRVTPAESAQDAAPGDALRLRFDQPMDRAAVEQSFVIDPPASGTFGWDADNELRFTPSSPGLLNGITYTVSISSSARSLAGTNLPSIQTWQFRTHMLNRVEAGLPSGQTISPTSDLTLTFSAPMNREETEKLVSLRADGALDSLRAHFSWNSTGTLLTISPEQPMPEGPVALNIQGGAKTQSGESLGSGAELHYTVTLPAPRLRFTVGRVRIVKANSAVPVTYEAVSGQGSELGQAGFALYALPGEKLSALGAQSSSWPSPLPAGLVQTLSPLSLPLAAPIGTLPQSGKQALQFSALPPGTYLLVGSAKSRQGETSDWQLILAADAALQTAGEGVLWATTGDGKPWAGCEVSLYSSDGVLTGKGVTDAQGLLMPGQPEWRGASLLLARDNNGHLAALLPGKAAPPATATGALPASLLTDMPAYKPGQTVNFRVLLHAAESGAAGAPTTPLTEQDVKVSLLNPEGAALSVLMLKPDDVGGVTGLFSLAPMVRPGTYRVRASAGDLWREFPLTVTAPRADGLSVFIVPQASATTTAGQAEFTAGVLGAGGGLRPGAKVTATLGIAGDIWSSVPVTATTNSSGLANLTIPLPEWTAHYADPGLLLRIETSIGTAAGHTETPIQPTQQSRPEAGIVELVSPSLGASLTVRPQRAGGYRVRVVSLQSQAGGSVLLQATDREGRSAWWTLDLSAAGGDVTVPVGAHFSGGRLSIFGAGKDMSRTVALPPLPGGNLTLAVDAPARVMSGAPLPLNLQLRDREGQGVAGRATLLLRRADGEAPSGSAGRQTWEPSLRIEAGGVATTTLPAPTDPGRWYISATAVTPEGVRVDRWTAIDVESGPVVQLPASLSAREGELLGVATVIYNPTANTFSSEVQAETRAGMQTVGAATQNVNLPARTWQRLEWTVMPQEAGETSLSFSFLPESGVPGRWSVPISVEPNASGNTTFASGVMSGERSIGVQVPSGAGGQIELKISAATTLPSALSGAAHQLSEGTQADAQTSTAAWAARLLAAPLLDAASSLTGRQDAPTSATRAGMERSQALQQLYAAQHPDGGWGTALSTSAGTSDPATTALVLAAMKRQTPLWERMGGEPQPLVDAEVVGRALDYLSLRAARSPDLLTSGSKLDERARITHALALYGRARLEDVRALIAYASQRGDGPRLSTAGQALLVQSLYLVGDAPSAGVLAQRLAPLPAGSEEGAAPTLEALLMLRQSEWDETPAEKRREASRATEPLRGVVRLLVERRQANLWPTYAETASALWALSLYAQQVETTGSQGAPQVLLNDRRVQAADSDPNEVSATLTGSALHAGTNWLRIQAPPGGEVYYSLTLRAGH